MQHTGHFVDGVYVPHADYTPTWHVGEQADFVFFVVGYFAVGAAQQRIGLDTNFAQFLHGVLRRLGFEFACSGNPRQVSEVHKSAVAWALLQAQLAHSLQERQRFDITHSATNFYDSHVYLVFRAYARTTFHIFLDFVGDVGNDLYGFAQIIATAFFF